MQCRGSRLAYALKEEDQLLLNYIRAHGQGSWRSLPKAAGLLRCGKSCRLRWINYLRPDLKRGNFTEEEVQIIIKLHSLLGNRWSLIAGRLAGRTDNEIKNYWNTHIKRKLISSGIDPQTHRPFNPNTCLDLRNSTPPPSMNDPTIYIHHESKCNSRTTEESNPRPPALDLGLSIGLLPFQSKYRKIASFNSSSSAESKSSQEFS
ncbi:hypothetical protein DH2020_007782 [Rehmannia glutinosa]|uniref:R2R3-MYB protein n=1 Tax=Rehmannia glutinosa TaxID=99300 RepID=A0ABR0TZ46_REHGL